MKRKLLFPLIAALLLTPWPVAYTYDDAMAGNSPMYIEAAQVADAPKINAYGNTIGGVTGGDLFHVDTMCSTADAMFTLYITNTDELVQHYRYMNLNVGIYVQTGTGQWERLTTGEGETPPDTYITMHNSMVNFVLPGYGIYKVTIDKGCYYCYGNGTEQSAVSPKFYLTLS